MRHLLWTILVGAYVTITVGLALIVGLAGLREYLRDRWDAFLSRRIGSVLEVERKRHAADLAEARRQHKDAQAWLLETHRMEIARLEARQRQRVDEAVAEAMTSRAPHPRLRAS